eukprot:7028602-Prymnesium_polylepis.1
MRSARTHGGEREKKRVWEREKGTRQHTGHSTPTVYNSGHGTSGIAIGSHAAPIAAIKLNIVQRRQVGPRGWAASTPPAKKGRRCRERTTPRRHWRAKRKCTGGLKSFRGAHPRSPK